MIALLNGHSLTKKERFVPESQPLNLAERASTTTLTVGPNAPEIGVGDWLQDETEPGSGIVWRVKSVDTQQETETRTIQLEHMINSLRDQLMFGEIKPQDMGGTAAGCSALQAVEYILARQSDWTLGSFDYGSVSNPYNFNGDDLFSALETVSSSLDGCWWSYDFSSYPFTINITQRASTVSTELRMSRNIQTARISIDRSRMYTRIYPIGKNNLHIDGDYISRNDNIYGVISKTETDQSKATKAELYRWAEERLARHCEPTVTVTVSALDLSDATGESLDHIQLGALCRLPLPGYDVIIEEIISKISYPDKLSEPDRATVTMANIPEDVASIINNLIKSGGSGGRAAAKNAEEDHAWFVDTTDHVAMIAEGIAGEGAAEDWSRVAELLVDGNGIHQRVTEAQADIVTAYSLIDQTTTAIRLEIGTVASEVRSFIQQTPDMIHAEVGYAVSGFAHSVIEQTATYIRMEVENAASEISQSVIEQTSQHVITIVEATASEVACSVIEQTMTGIIQEVHRKSKVYVQWDDPNDGTNVLYEGDVWIKRQTNRTWNEANAAHEAWNQNGVSWRSKYGDLQYVWKNGKWNLLKDTSTDVENEVRIEQNAEDVSIVGRAVTLQGEEFNSKLTITAREIRGEVSTAKSQIYTVIEQTATNIRTEVANVQAGLQSSIEQTASSITTSVSAAKSAMYSVIQQTATNIRTEVANVQAGLQSSIEQTASSITTSVSAAKSAMYSVIQQTATQIRAEVASAVSGLRSSITVEANRISLVVEGTGSNAKIKPASIVAAINNGASSIIISANHINLDGYVKATDITANLISSKISLISTITAQAIEADSVKIRPVSGMGLVNVATAYNGSSLTRSGNTYTLRLAKMNGNYDEYSFSRAVASVDWSLSNGTLKATPQPQNQEFTLGSLTSYRVFSHNAQATPSNFDRAANGYYIKDSGSGATVRIYTGADMTIGGKVLYSTSCNVDDYLETMPTNVYRDGYNTGFDASHTLVLGDSNDDDWAGYTKNMDFGETFKIWAGMLKSGGGYQWNLNPITITAPNNPHPNLFSLKCTGKTQTYPGSTEYNYTFALLGSRTSFSVDTSYSFYR